MAKKIWERMQEDAEANKLENERIRQEANQRVQQERQNTWNEIQSVMNNSLSSIRNNTNKPINNISRNAMRQTTTEAINDLNKRKENNSNNATGLWGQIKAIANQNNYLQLGPTPVNQNETSKTSIILGNIHNDQNIESNNKNIQKNENIMQDAGTLANLTALGVSTGVKNIGNAIESSTEQRFPIYKKLKEMQYQASPKVSEEEKAQAKLNQYVNDNQKIETNLVKKAIRDSILKDEEKIQEEQSKLSNSVTQALGEVAPSMGQMLPGTALSAVNPLLGTEYFYASSKGSYINDALKRGMNEEQADKYGTIMAVLESASETVITGQQLNKISNAFKGKQISKSVLDSYGFNIFENAVQEAVMEPAQELTAQIVGGNDKADWSNMWGRMLQSGFNGGLMGAISNGVTFRLEKSGNVYNKLANGEQVTESEYKEALQENIDRFGKKKVEEAIKSGASEVYQEVNNVISKKQSTTMQNEQTNLPTQQVNRQTQENALNQNVVTNNELPVQENNQRGKSFEEIVDEAMSNYEFDEVPSPLQNRDIKTIGKETKVNAYQYDNPEVKPYFQQMAQMLGEDVGNIASSDNRKTTKGGGTALSTNIPAIKQLKEMGYSYNQIIDGIVDIIDDHGQENNALSKKIEIILDDQLRNGYTNSYGQYIRPNEEYISLISKDNVQNNQVLPIKQLPVQENASNQNVMANSQDRNKRLQELKSIDTSNMGFIERGKIKTEIRALEQGFNSIEEYQKAEQIKREQAQKEYEQRQKEKELEKIEQQQQLEKEIQESNPAKRAQYEIIQKTNPMLDDYHTGIRSPKDIKTFNEVINDEESFAWGDFSKEDAQNALEQGKITIYSSYPIENGTFVSTSKVQAEDYAGGKGKKVYSKEVPLGEVAWINGDEGQYAKVDSLANNQQVNNFSGYTQKEINNIKSNKISIAQSSEDISKFVNNSRKISGNFKMYLGKIKENASNLIKNKLGINVDNYNISLKTDDVRKIFKDHGSEKTEIPRGQVPITENDFLNIPDIINNPDSISLEGKSPQEKPAIKFEKNIDGNTVVVTYVSDKHNNLEMQTMYKFKNNKKRDSATALHENQAPGLNTSEMDSGTNLFINNSIPQNNEVVKNDTITNNYEQNSENNTQNTQGEEINWNEVEKPQGKFRKHYQSIIESSNTTAEAKAIAKEIMGTDTYIPESNKNLIKKADARISNTDPNTELSSLYSRVMNNEKVSDIDIAVGERLIEYYSKIGDSEHLLDAIHATAMAGTQAGRTVQAMALLNHMTPQGQVTWLQRSIDKANTELQDKFKNKKNIPQFELTQDMVDKVLNTNSKEEMYKALDDVYEELGQQVPKSTSEKIDEWRYFSMLANAKTHARNMIGNVAMHATQRVKDKVAGVIEGTVAKFNPKMERTHTIMPASKEVKQFAKNDLKNMDVRAELGMNENKYNPQSRLQNARKTFKSDVLNNTLGKLFDLNSKALEVEDNIGLKSMYVKALSEYITANKLDVNNMTDTQLQKARQYAIKSAQEATFHQASTLATALQQMGRRNKIAKFALDSAVPFKKTPINVAKTGVQYSPVGLIKSAIYDTAQLRKGNITVNQYIDNISKGLTGTGIAYMGYVLAEAGIIKASGDDDDRKEKYDEEQGKQKYSIEIAGNTYSLDWLSPVGIPLFIGVEANQQFNQSTKEKNTKSTDDDNLMSQILKRVSNVASASTKAMNPMSEMSMISGLTDVLTSFNQENSWANIGTNIGKSYVNQFVPTLLGQVARTTDDYERTTKSTKTDPLEKAIDSTWNQIKSKIPGLRQTLPTKTDIWGKDVKQSENLPFRAFNNFLNPAKVQEVSTDSVDKELNNLYARTKESSIIPKTIENKFSINGTDYRMTNDEYAKYSKDYGKTSHDLLQKLIKTNDYKNLTDKQKQEAIEDVYSYAKENNKVNYANKVKEELETSSLYNTIEDLKKNGGNISSYLSYKGKTSDIQGEKETMQKNTILKDSDYDNTTKSIIYRNNTGKNDNLYDLVENINMNQYLDYKIKDSNKEFSADKDKNGKTISGSAKKKVYDYINSTISGYENRLMLLAKEYKLTRAEQQAVVNQIAKTSKSNEEALEKFKKLSSNFEVKDGQVYFK